MFNAETIGCGSTYRFYAMKIGVCLKQVPAQDAALRVDWDRGWVREIDTAFETNEPDTYALEEALRLKDAKGAEVVAISVGPERCAYLLKDALAKGADGAVHVLDQEVHQREPMELAEAIGAVLRDKGFDLILAGSQSADYGYGQTGIILAALLGMPHASMAVQLGLDQNRLRLVRELESGWSQRIEILLPCVVTMQSGTNRPRYANIKGIMSAKQKPIRTLAWSDLPVSSTEGSQRIRKIVFPQRSRATEFLDGTPGELATRLCDILKHASGGASV
ncbi:MAG: electron transfer flavoprotein subunit beta/FixA family protein [Gammaproteobacteria bacterium]